jgi:hypothetical protein
MSSFDHGTKHCCICGGLTTLYITSSAHVTIEGKEYRVFYHTSCFTEDMKEKISNLLNEMATKGEQ